jgi:hypothetical protein
MIDNAYTPFSLGYSCVVCLNIHSLAIGLFVVVQEIGDPSLCRCLCKRVKAAAAHIENIHNPLMTYLPHIQNLQTL